MDMIIRFHPHDLARLVAVAERSHVEPEAVIQLAVHRFLERLETGEENPPGNALGWQSTGGLL